MKKVLIIVGAILVIGLVAAGSFWGGMTYKTNQDNQARANFMSARGLTDGGQLPPGGFDTNIAQGFPGGGATNGQAPAGFPGGRGTTGQVKTIAGNVMTISTAQDVTTVNLSDTTQIEKSSGAAISDLQPGMQVTVTGQRDKDGNIAASRILINNSASNPMNVPATGTAP